ncbi:heparinase II/III family protein [Neiella marina]|uniref:Heparinase II/III family protein n=2 Tax=Neiella holothuriorum TaxID=2870530 RepID=A0ABS7ECA5_9GAMM|nr:alginate lyase family protein [Neiella holothuriorum]MBW8189845.1 heparinase II/III family protein [Neiella holothuriorum]
MICSFFIAPSLQAKEHPSLILTKQGVKDIRANLGKLPVFDNAVKQVQAQVDAEIALGIDTPIPKDYSGGYTHERHKLNFVMAQKAGTLYQILQDEKYAKYVKDMLFQYEAMYLDLPVHPKPRSYARGKIFWQCLNDSNWLVYMAQAYDTIYDYLTAAERKTLEDNLFRPFADFISTGNPQFFNRIHNHSTWGNAAVGMIALVMDDDELLERALYGLDDDGIEFGTKDDDGGFLKVEGQKAGFLANLEDPFSPSGYFTEGPYYQRYAMYPFLVFALGMENSRPDVGVLQHKDDVLIKGVYALLNLSDKKGEFFALNDGQKGMSLMAKELVTAVNTAYYYGDQDPTLLSIAADQGTVLLDQSGLAVAKAIEAGKAKPYVKPSVNYGDGPNGDQGGVAVVRYGDSDLELVFKYSAQGLSHGHYDKLSYSLFEGGDEVAQDYGLSRFVNIEKKGGGNYLPENASWAKQTIAHNTVTQNETSHFGGDYATGSQHHSDLYFYESNNDAVQVVSATEVNAYPGTKLHRTMAVIKDEGFEKPFLLDIVRIDGSKRNQYDLPFYFNGQVLETTFDYEQPEKLAALGDKNGYQHLWVEGVSKPLKSDSWQFTWINEAKYYTLTSSADKADQVMFTRIGANDPLFNLRRDAGIMIRRDKSKDTTFASVIEPHGAYSPVTELSLNANSSINALDVLQSDDDYTAVKITTVDDRSIVFILANSDASTSKKHKLKAGGKTYKWKGAYYLGS